MERTSGQSANLSPAVLVSRNARQFPTDVAVIADGYEMTYEELARRVAQGASLLSRLGVVRGDRVAYLGLNSASFFETFLAAAHIGAIFVPLNHRLTSSELREVLASCAPAAMVVEEGHRALAEGARRSMPSAVSWILVGRGTSSAPRPWHLWPGPVDVATADPSVAVGMHDPALLMYTSGTTGRPKGVILTFGNLFWNWVNVNFRLDVRRGDVTLVAAPLFHVGGLNTFALGQLVRGGTVVLQRNFRPAEFMAALERYRVNSTLGVPYMFAEIARNTDVASHDLSALRTVVVAGAPVPRPLLAQFERLGVSLQQAWGLTETAPMATHLPVELSRAKPGSAGLPMPYVELRVTDPVTGDDLPAGSIGELLVRGPNVSPGYWLDQHATDAAFDADGWFRSGDVGYIDPDGFLYVIDRSKDMIITGGENVYPAEVEAAITDHPGVREVAVTGLRDDLWGEVVVAVITVSEASETAPPSLEDIRTHAAARLAKYKLPRRLVIVSDIPRTASGKVNKGTLRTISDGVQ